jgi:hypothetical protein
MKHPGTITLYSEHGTRLSFYRYYDKYMRRYTLKYWQEVYGDRYTKFYYHIEPDTYEEQTLKVA